MRASQQLFRRLLAHRVVALIWVEARFGDESLAKENEEWVTQFLMHA